MNISDYQNVLFDCDGVVLDSNKIKTLGFYHSVLRWGREGAELLVKHHVANGGISRYKKFSFYLENIFPEYGETNCTTPSIEMLCDNYSNYIKESMLMCPCASNLDQLKRNNSIQKWYIVSGGDQTELRDIFSKRDLTSLFDGGIFGSPNDKFEIIRGLLDNKILTGSSIFIGDSKYDYDVAKYFNFDFLFVSDWSEVENWSDFVKSKQIASVPSISSLE